MRVALLLVVCLAGCRQILGLDDRSFADADLADEDGDGVLDATDDCPGVFDVDQGDGDFDGVGDACDPKFGGGDARIASFFFNDRALDPADWIATTGWNVGVGFVQTNTTPPSVLTSNFTPSGTRVTLEIGYEVLIWGVAGNELVVRIDQSASCGLNDENSSDGVTTVRVEVAQVASIATTQMVLENTRRLIMFTLDRSTGFAECRVPEQLIAGGPVAPQSAFEIATTGNSVRVHHIIVYRSE